MLEEVPQARATLEAKTVRAWGSFIRAGSTALHMAARTGKRSCYYLLVDHGADQGAEDCEGEKPWDLKTW